jgi:tetratricopeptide (TPR) repeat protein
MVTDENIFPALIEAPLEVLREWRLTNQIPKDFEGYANILISYLSADVPALQKTLENTNHLETSVIARLRLNTLLLKYEENDFREMEKLVSIKNFWAAEAAFVLGISYWRFQRNFEAKSAFLKAHLLLQSIGAKKKAAKSLLNVVVSDSRIDPSRRLFPEYQIVAAKALEVGAIEVAGICHQNISKELRSLGAFELALKHSHEALNLMGKDSGTLHYFETLLHRCHLYIELGRMKEARIDFEASFVSQHPQITEARHCIERFLGSEVEINHLQLEPVWVEKLSTKTPSTLTPTEVSFIEILKTGRVSRESIILSMYGESTDWESAKNRFKVFLNRFKKKHRGVICEEGQDLLLVDNSILSDLQEIVS